MLSSVASRTLSGCESVVKVSFMPAFTLFTSPSAICILLSMVLKSATCTMVGVV